MDLEWIQLSKDSSFCLLGNLKGDLDVGILDKLQQESSYSVASGDSFHYVVLQVTLKEKFIGTGTGNLTVLEKVINNQANKGYRLHTITTTNGGSKGLFGGDRIQATMIFEKVTG